MKNKIVFALSILNLPAILWAILQCPESQVAVHFNAVGVADRYSSKWTYLLFALLPLALSFFYWLYRKKTAHNPKLQKNRKYEEIFVPLLTLLFLIIGWLFAAPVLLLGQHALVASTLGLVPLLLSLLFAYISCIMPKVKHNHFFGLRVSWTLNSEIVWRKTHRMVGYTGFVSSLISIIFCIVSFCMGRPELSLFGIAFVIVGGVVIPCIYAWRISKEEAK